MTDTTRNAFETWLDEPHPADPKLLRRDYMPRHDGGFAAMAWQAATLAERDKRQPLTDEQIDKCVEQVCGSFAEFDEVRLFTRAIEAAHWIKA